MSGKVKCTCGWSWNKSDSSKKDMYVCHECGRDNSNNMKNGGWLDNYGEEDNYNDYNVSASEGFEGDGYSNVGRNSSPAWGGQFQEGGEIPNAQKGKKLKPITTNDPADPRLHKYLDSLNLYKGYELSKKYNIQDENAKLVPKTLSKGKIKYSKASVDPHNSYEDYLIYQKKFSKKFNETYDKQGMEGIKKDPFFNTKKAKTNAFKTKKDLGKYAKEAEQLANEYEKLSFREPTETGYWKTPDLYHPTISDIGSYYKGSYNPIFKKPNQEVIYSGNPSDVAALRQKPYIAGVTNPKVQEQVRLQRPNIQAIQNNLHPAGLVQPDFELEADVDIHNRARIPKYYDVIDKVNQNFGGSETQYKYYPDNGDLPNVAPSPYNTRTVTPHYQMGGSVYPVNYVPEAQTGGSFPGATGFSYARTGSIPSKGPRRNQTDKTDASAQNGKEMQYYQQGLDFQPKTISRDGSIIKDDRGQWDHPGEITEINSNDITMEGVPYDVLGISDTGDTKLMKPGKNYKFKGKKVTEFPMAKNGLRQEQKGLQNLDNLVNFTNYNTKQSGGWLDQY